MHLNHGTNIWDLWLRNYATELKVLNTALIQMHYLICAESLLLGTVKQWTNFIETIRSRYIGQYSFMLKLKTPLEKLCKLPLLRSKISMWFNQRFQSYLGHPRWPNLFKGHPLIRWLQLDRFLFHGTSHIIRLEFLCRKMAFIVHWSRHSWLGFA